MNPTRKIDILCAVGLAAAVGVSAIMAVRLVGEDRARAAYHNRALDQLRKELRTAKGEVTLLREAERAARRYREEASSRSLPDRKLLPYFDAVQRLAEENQVRVLDLRQQAGAPAAATGRIGIVMRCQGSFPHLHRFLHGLETLGPLLLMENVTFQADAAAQACSLTLRAALLSS